jgi:4-amino-4-deoxy-L-arabinose transferase-like glycosyltransferase
MFLSAGIGVEFFLVGYQIANNTYCPYCLVFAAIIVMQFLFNLDVSKKLLILVFMALGFLGFFIFFEGSVFPVYGGATIPNVSAVSVVGTVQAA